MEECTEQGIRNDWGTSSDPLHGLGQSLGSLSLFLLNDLGCMSGQEAGKKHGRILGVFLKSAFMQNRSVTVLQALCSSLGRERVRAALASSVLRLQFPANRSSLIAKWVRFVSFYRCKKQEVT